MQKRAELEQAKKKHVPSMKVVKTVKMKLDLPSFCGFESSSSVGWHWWENFWTMVKMVTRSFELESTDKALREAEENVLLRQRKGCGISFWRK